LNIEAERAQSVGTVHKDLTERDRRRAAEYMEATAGRCSKPRGQLRDGKGTQT
jgi:hypothetical protein